MSAFPSQQTSSGLLGDAIQTTKLLHRSDKRCRYAMEIGGIGFVLMMGMSLFGGSSGSGGSCPYGSRRRRTGAGLYDLDGRAN